MTKRIYAYTVVGKDSEPWERVSGQTVTRGKGLIKVGETRSTARARIREQLGTVYPNLEGVTILLEEQATRSDGAVFGDHDVHTVLVRQGVKRPGGEWFEATVEDVKSAINVVRFGTTFNPRRTEAFPMRPEQREAVTTTAKYFHAHANEKKPLRFLWNAKMRFGKTFTAYQLARKLGWTKVLVLSYKPAVRTSWKDDLLTHVDFADWTFIDRESSSQERDKAADARNPTVWFASFQDLIDKTDDGQIKDHNENLHLIDWDCIVLDEYHFGAWRNSARDLYDPTDAGVAETEEPEEQVDQDDLGLTTNHLLYLSGTPFRAITNGEFTEDQIFNWTYVDEQTAKAAWDVEQGPNPYLPLPRMEIFAYQMGKDTVTYAEDGEFNVFSLTEYFKARKVNPSSRDTSRGSYVFERPDEVAEFLEMLRGKLPDQMKSLVVGGQKAPFPYEHQGFKSVIRHSVWYMADVASCFAMRDLLEGHPYFLGFEVVVAAGPKAGQGAEAKPPVETAIGLADRNHESGSITLTCGKLMTGVTVREWGAILMLRSLKAPETYFQAAFRVQSPWTQRDAEGHDEIRKETCYVFEFDPNRAMRLVAEYGVRLASTGEVTPAEAIGQLLNYLPIYAFEGGQMTQLDAANILDWASAGIGATALARRWDSPLLVEVNEHTLGKLLEHQELLATLDQIEDFRALVNNAQQVVTSTKMLKKAKRDQGGKLTPEQSDEEKSTNALRKEIREKLQKFLAKIPVFMYVTDFREEALKHVIESLDSDLFERVTGLTVNDFKLLNDIGLFNAQHMNHAIYQFRSFERASLLYANDDREQREKPEHHTVGLWDRSVDEDESPDVSAVELR